MTALTFDDATEALRRLHLEGDALADIAHAAGRSTRNYAADLLAHLTEVRATVEAAARGGGQTLRIGARESMAERYVLLPGGAILTRPAPSELAEVSALPAEPLPPRMLRADATGQLDATDLRPGEAFVPAEELP
ncbi:hypothetical protein LOK46_29695 [Methylobacterium sp. NMS14P]|uniref:hypothetical protein n=1 Tax=Methylobacterium sp. NMS14P TaxID=2894310 RepID=UPI002358B45C|nr:hypothetical protein [Methylobacterium sp. NMS14P]WCS25241.1 hypothetical protein LOK46_29695 [Methylobacterium sp. NMS14P]